MKKEALVDHLLERGFPHQSNHEIICRLAGFRMVGNGFSAWPRPERYREDRTSREEAPCLRIKSTALRRKKPVVAGACVEPEDG